MKRSAAGGDRVVLAGDQVPGRDGLPGRDAGGLAESGQRSRPLGRGHHGGGDVGAGGAEGLLEDGGVVGGIGAGGAVRRGERRGDEGRRGEAAAGGLGQESGGGLAGRVGGGGG